MKTIADRFVENLHYEFRHIVHANRNFSKVSNFEDGFLSVLLYDNDVELTEEDLNSSLYYMGKNLSEVNRRLNLVKGLSIMAFKYKTPTH